MGNDKYEKTAKYMDDFDNYVLPWLIKHKCNTIAKAEAELIKKGEKIKYNIFQNLLQEKSGKEYISSSLWSETKNKKIKYRKKGSE